MSTRETLFRSHVSKVFEDRGVSASIYWNTLIRAKISITATITTHQAQDHRIYRRADPLLNGNRP